MAKIVLLLFAVALIQGAYSLKCYNCITTTGNTHCEDMSTGDKSVQELTCPGVGVDKLACMKKVTMDTTSKKMSTTRSCINDRDKEVLCRAAPNNEVKFCDTCTDDLCNSSTRTRISFVTVFGIFSSLLVKYFLN